MFFEGKPETEIRTELKKNGFKWTPSKECWQNYINRNSVDFAIKIAKR